MWWKRATEPGPDTLSPEAACKVICRRLGRTSVNSILHEVDADLAMEPIRKTLPLGFRFFERGDYMGLAGASRWTDFVEPIIGPIKVLVDTADLREDYQEPDGQDGVIEVDLVISADEEKMGGALLGVTLYGENDAGGSPIMVKTVETRAQAIALAHLFVSSGQVAVSTLNSLGFEIVGTA